jgi:hypothetical protein
MKLSILSFLKGASIAAVVLAVPAFAVYNLVACALGSPTVVVASEHDPLQNVARVVDAPTWTRTRAASGVENDSPWTFTVNPKIPIRGTTSP